MNSAKIQINGKSLSYSFSGKGKSVVLLHGYLESKELWEEVASVLSSKYFVICPDLPGQGDSEPHEKQTMESMAESVSKLLDHLKIDKTYLFGHSMGGYVTLAFAELFNQKLLGIGLLHSHPFKDSDEKQKQRSQEIELVKNGKRELIIKSSVPNYFASEFAGKSKEAVEKSIHMAMKTKDNGMIACIFAMMKRKDRLDVLKKCQIPILLIAGRKDKLIPCDKAIETANEVENIHFSILENSGHVGMVEEPLKTIQIIQEFILKY